jgi:hypothetical protein
MIKRRVRAATMIKFGHQPRHECLKLPRIVERCHDNMASLMALGVVAVVIDNMTANGVVIGIYRRHGSMIPLNPVRTPGRFVAKRALRRAETFPRERFLLSASADVCSRHVPRHSDSRRAR